MFQENTYYWAKYDINSPWEIVKVEMGHFKFFSGGTLSPKNVYKFIELKAPRPQNEADDLIRVIDLDIYVGTWRFLELLNVSYLQELATFKEKDLIRHAKCTSKVLEEIKENMNKYAITFDQ